MVTFLITSVLILGLIGIAIYFWQKPAPHTETYELPPPKPAALFAGDAQPEVNAPAPFPTTPQVITEPVMTEVRTAPTESQENEAQSAKQAESGATEAEHRAKKEEAIRFIESWPVSPDRKSTAKMLHLAATADDADTYCRAVEVALNIWLNSGIPDLSAAELQNLFNSEFWLLSNGTRSSGAGFVLKQTLARASRELERANNPTA